jgi:23S rRNA (guanosine2251-2'-O)-methyltransferase
MKEFIYSLNAVYEILRAQRRDIYKIQVAGGIQEKGRLAEIIKRANEQRVRMDRVPRGRFDMKNTIANRPWMTMPVDSFFSLTIT